MKLFTDLNRKALEELAETIKEDKILTSYIIKIREQGAELPVEKKRELCCALHEIHKEFFEKKEEPKPEPRQQEKYFYENQTDNLGYQTVEIYHSFEKWRSFG